jgi:hypothetical protein
MEGCVHLGGRVHEGGLSVQVRLTLDSEDYQEKRRDSIDPGRAKKSLGIFRDTLGSGQKIGKWVKE